MRTRKLIITIYRATRHFHNMPKGTKEGAMQMKDEHDEYRGVTRDQMLGDIVAGRNAIERSLLNALIRSLPGNQAAHDTEMAELRALLALYNRMMARFEQPVINIECANDEDGAIN